MLHPLAQLGHDTRRWLRSTETLCKAIVSNYAVPLAIVNDSFDHAYVVNDFIYYCFTKSTKTLAAINTLLDDGFGEDAQILVRTSYEGYLAVAFLSAHPQRLDDLVAKKIGLKTGDFTHPVTPAGRTDYRRVIDSESGEILPLSLSVAEMAALTKYPEDSHVHRPLYGFLPATTVTQRTSGTCSTITAKSCKPRSTRRTSTCLPFRNSQSSRSSSSRIGLAQGAFLR